MLTPKVSPYCPHRPTDKQALALVAHRFMPQHEPAEVFYGGAAGGGKSDWLLMAALEHVDVPGYAGLLLRRTFQDLALPGAIMARSREWLTGKAHWNEQRHKWTFPTDASVTFGYLRHEDDVYQYQSAEFQFIGFDELTQFTEWQYRYMRSRCRRPAEGILAGGPLRVYSASNPGGIGHGWVKKYFGLKDR